MNREISIDDDDYAEGGVQYPKYRYIFIPPCRRRTSPSHENANVKDALRCATRLSLARRSIKAKGNRDESKRGLGLLMFIHKPGQGQGLTRYQSDPYGRTSGTFTGSREQFARQRPRGIREFANSPTTRVTHR